MYISRRDFVKTGLILGASTALLPAVFRRAFASSVVEGASGTTANRTLVIVQMAGGNDGLNAVIPFAAGRYYSQRQNIAIPQGRVIALDKEVGLHPGLTSFKSLWDEGALAIVEGVGYPNPSFSHFQAMDIWQQADPQGKARDGWLGRYLERLDRTQVNAFEAIAVGNSQPKALVSSKVAIPIVENIATYQFPGDRDPVITELRTRALLKLYASTPREAPYAVLLDNTAQAAYTSAQALKKADQEYKPGATYPQNSFANGLKLLAEAITGGLGVTIGHISVGGWDTHANEASDHTRLLPMLADSLAAFYQDLKTHGKDKDVLIMTWSEFGRRVKSNASGGTDHGSAGPMFIIGAPVKGGLYGERPDLGNLDNGNLRFTTDFRAVYTTVLEQWLGVSSEAVVPGQRFEPLPFLSIGSTRLSPAPRQPEAATAPS